MRAGLGANERRRLQPRVHDDLIIGDDALRHQKPSSSVLREHDLTNGLPPADFLDVIDQRWTAADKDCDPIVRRDFYDHGEATFHVQPNVVEQPIDRHVHVHAGRRAGQHSP